MWTFAPDPVNAFTLTHRRPLPSANYIRALWTEPRDRPNQVTTCQCNPIDMEWACCSLEALLPIRYLYFSQLAYSQAVVSCLLFEYKHIDV